MEIEEIQQRNKAIALMLGAFTKKMMGINSWVLEEDELNLSFDTFDKELFSNDGGSGWLIKDLKFHTDWNWLMEAVEFINKTHKNNNPYRDLHYTIGYLLHGGWWENTKVPERLLSDKTQLFLAVSDFAKLYNEKNL